MSNKELQKKKESTLLEGIVKNDKTPKELSLD